MYTRHHIGVMTTPNMGNAYNPAWPYWAADNGCFTQPDRYTDTGYLAWLDARPPTALFATAPDVLCDWPATMARSRPLLAVLRTHGQRAAIVTQDGATADTVPWDDIDAVFIGGSDACKESQHTAAIVTEANRRGVWAHMGRVNSRRRLRLAHHMGCDSVDGTFFAFGPDVNIRKVATWLAEIRTQPSLFDQESA